MTSAALLSCRDVTVRFGGIVALQGVSFDVEPGTICGIIGPNGAGKTTLFNCLSRLYEPTGSIVFDGTSLIGLPRHRIAHLGIGRTFQNLALFRTMSVRANIAVGAHCRMHAGFLASGLSLPYAGKEQRALGDEVHQLIQMFGLESVANAVVSKLPFGTQKRVEFARAMASHPRLLLLDEPAAGLNHEEVEELRTLIISLRERLQMSVLLIEHHMSFVMGLCDHVVALDFGRKIADGSPAVVRSNADVIRAYLGVE